MAGSWNGSTYQGDNTNEKVPGRASDDRIFGAGGDDTLNGGAGNDSIRGQQGDDVVVGGAGNDTVDGDDGFSTPDGSKHDDQVSGGDGSDSVSGGYGADTLNGDGGDDVLSLRYGGGPDAVDLVYGGRGVDTLAIAFDESLDVSFGATTVVKLSGRTVARAFEIERLTLSLGAGDQSVTAGGGDDIVSFDAGSDTIVAGDGDDVVGLRIGGKDNIELSGGDDRLNAVLGGFFLTDGLEPGASRYDGGTGEDLINVDLRESDLAGVSFADGVLKVAGKAVATAKNFESVSFVGPSGGALRFSGLAGDDTCSGSAADDFLRGGAGNDRLNGAPQFGSAGGDTLDGGAGFDTITLKLDAKADRVVGGAGTDTLIVSPQSFGAPGAIVMTGDLGGSATIRYDGAVAATVAQIERLSFFGGSGDDVVLGGIGDDDLRIGEGADRASTGAGADRALIELDGKTDRISLGTGTDTVEIDYADIEIPNSGVEKLTMSLGSNGMTFKTGSTTAAVVDGADIFDVRGGSAADSLIGGDFDDSLSGLAGANTLRGGGGDDALSLAADALRDLVSGGAGDDRLRFGGTPGAKVEIDVKSGSAFDVIVGGKIVVRTTDVESMFVDGSTEGDALTGLASRDVFYADAGADTLTGGGGDDLLVGEAGIDRLNGGDGLDTAAFYEATKSVVVVLKGGQTVRAVIGGVNDDFLNSIEGLAGGSGDDTLVGDRVDNLFLTSDGQDVIDGGAGVDSVEFNQGPYGLSLTLQGSRNAVAETGGDRTTLRNIENVAGSGGDDTITGDGADNRISGSSGADVLSGGKGADAFAYEFPSESGPITSGGVDEGHDVIADFTVADGDVIDLSAIDVDAGQTGDQGFSFIGRAQFSGDGAEVRFEKTSSATFLYADADGDGQIDMTIEFTGSISINDEFFIL